MRKRCTGLLFFALSIVCWAGRGSAQGLEIPTLKPAPAADETSASPSTPTDLSSCVASATVLCIDNNPGDHRWRVGVAYSTVQDGGQVGDAPAIALGGGGVNDGGLFWFFSRDNPEILIKVLNGCGVNGAFWVFFGATTNVGFVLTVTDTVNGGSRVFVNNDGVTAVPVQDTQAFSCTASDLALARSSGPAPTTASLQSAPHRGVTESQCVTDTTTLCIDERFSVTVNFASATAGQTGVARAVDLSGLGVTEGGLFWFFNPNNPELLIKVLDGCSVTQNFWVFFAAATNVGFTLTITDTQTGTSHTYKNSDGVPAMPIEDTAALPCRAANFFVATNGNDSWSGALAVPNGAHSDGPFASVARAQQAARPLAGKQSLAIDIRGGTYFLPVSPTQPGTLQFGATDSGTSTFPVTWQNYPGETPILSGGIPVGRNGLGLTWTQVGTSLWQVTLPAPTRSFEDLFYATGKTFGGAGTRRLRSRVLSAHGVGFYMSGTQCMAIDPNHAPAEVDVSQCNLGTFLRVASVVAQSSTTCSAADSASDGKGHTKCLDRFVYNAADPIVQFANLNGVYTGNSAVPCATNPSSPYPQGDVELTLFGASTVDRMRIGCIDTTRHVIYLTGPTKKGSGANYNFFGPGAGKRYVIENAKDSFTAAESAGQTGLWFLDRSGAAPVLSYLAGVGESPNADTIVLPQLGGVVAGAPVTDASGASLLNATNLKHALFRGLSFEVDSFYPSATGFNNDVNGELTLPQAIDCEGCQNVTFDSITVQHTSASAILIASSASSAQAKADAIQNSTFYDLGSSGIRVGHQATASDTSARVVTDLTVFNNLVQGFSRVYPDGEGIAQGNGNKVVYVHNDILDGYHAGISICNLGCPGSTTGANGSQIVSEYNHLRNLMQGITSDGGSLYFNTGGASGSGAGNRIDHNLIHDTSDASIIDRSVDGIPTVPGSGYGGEGIYLDSQTAGIGAIANVVYRVSAHALSISGGPAISAHPDPNVFSNNIFAFALRGMVEVVQPWPAGCGAQPGLQLEMSNNVFAFDQNETPGNDDSFQVLSGCTNSCGLPYDRFQSFAANAYFRTGTAASGFPKFCSDANAFRVLKNPPANGGCPGDAPTVALTFEIPVGGKSTWQAGAPPITPVPIDEDTNGTCGWSPSFGTTGDPTDYLVSTGPPTLFDPSLTNQTIFNAGRISGPHSLAAVLPTFPTYTFSVF
jgi:hypothetical protein